MSYNYVDIGIVVVLAVFVILGIRRGFLAGAADIVVMLLAFLLAVRGYGLVSAWIAQAISLPRILVNIISLVGLFIVAEWLFGLFVGALLGLVYRYLLPGPVRWLDSIGGVLPGFVKGLLIGTVTVTLLSLFPLDQSLRSEIQASTLGAQLAVGASAAAPRLESLFGGSAQETALFITQPVNDQSPRKMSFPTGIALRDDPSAEERMLVLLNEERVKAGVKPLVLDVRLRGAGRKHSEDMFRQAYFAHESPNGDSPADRLRRDNIPYLVMGENLAYAPSVEVAHTGLMNSPGHRKNILAFEFGRVGIGVVDGGLYGKMFSQEFAN